MVSEKKLQTVKEVKKLVKEYPVIGLVNLHKLKSKQLYEIRENLRDKAIIKVVKKNLIKLIFKETNIKMEEYIEGEPALIFSKEDAFKLARSIEKNKSLGPAKPGDVAEKDIVIPPGPTPLSPGPAIGELQKVGLVVGVEGGKIAVKKEKIIVKAGETITPEVASVLGKLNIYPIEVKLNLVAAYENGMVYTKDVLFVPLETYIENIKTAYKNALYLSMKIGLYNKENIKWCIIKAFNEAQAVSHIMEDKKT